MRSHHRLPLALLLAAAAVIAPHAAIAQQQVDDTRAVSPTVRVEIDDIIVGRIHVVGTSGTDMTVTGTIGADVDELVIEGGPDTVEISVELYEWDEGNGRRRRRDRDHSDVDVNLQIGVPAGASLEIEGVTATFEVEGVDGEIDIESVTGDITYSGNATMLELTNVTGSITATAGDVDEGDLESINGSISYTGGVAAGGELSLENVNGSIDLTVPADISARFSVETMMGGIDNEFGQEPHRESRWVPSQELHFTNGAGSAEIDVETLQGSVAIRKR